MTSVINVFDKETFYLSNFYEVPVLYKGIHYKSSEAAYQAQKTVPNTEETEQTLQKFAELNPAQSKKLGRKIKIREDWDDIKDSVMYEVVKAKFCQHMDLAVKLVATYPSKLEEGNTWGDRYWGTVDGVGRNQLGITLMRVREELMKAGVGR